MQGIALLQQLEQKIEHASSQALKEKAELDMKKEIKKLQRLRDFFKQGLNSGEIKDKQKLQDYRKKIETEMEKFREHEKEFKLNKLTKSALQNISETESKFMFEDEEDDLYAEENDSSPGASDDDQDSGDLLLLDKQWLAKFLSEHLKKLTTGVEHELTEIKNKKKSRNSKNKEKISALMKKLEEWKRVRDRAEELTISMDYLDAGSLKELRGRARRFLQSPDDEELQLPVIEEIEILIETSEQNRKK